MNRQSLSKILKKIGVENKTHRLIKLLNLFKLIKFRGSVLQSFDIKTEVKQVTGRTSFATLRLRFRKRGMGMPQEGDQREFPC